MPTDVGHWTKCLKHIHFQNKNQNSYCCNTARSIVNTYRSPLKMGPIGCPETSVMSYHSSLCNKSEERSSHLLILYGRSQWPHRLRRGFAAAHLLGSAEDMDVCLF